MRKIFLKYVVLASVSFTQLSLAVKSHGPVDMDSEGALATELVDVSGTVKKLGASYEFEYSSANQEDMEFYCDWKRQRMSLSAKSLLTTSGVIVPKDNDSDNYYLDLKVDNAKKQTFYSECEKINVLVNQLRRSPNQKLVFSVDSSKDLHLITSVRVVDKK